MKEPGFVKRGKRYVPAIIIRKASGAEWAEMTNGIAVIGCEVESVDDRIIAAIGLDKGAILESLKEPS